jgi:succinate dehydrogenase / fumarate reductase iron-sulfur subunit
VAPGEYRMHQVDVDRSQEFRKCIECFLCQTVCHVIRDHEENKQPFAGPRLFIRAAELDMHPLDDRTDRKDYAAAEQGLGYCNITKCCTEVCPEHIKITDNAIIPMKERVVDNRYDPLVWLGRKILRRDQVAAHAGASEGPRVVGLRETPAGQPPEVGPDGKLPISEVLFDRPGAASPFGDDVSFPLPTGSITYDHPGGDHATHESTHPER